MNMIKKIISILRYKEDNSLASLIKAATDLENYGKLTEIDYSISSADYEAEGKTIAAQLIAESIAFSMKRRVDSVLRDTLEIVRQGNLLNDPRELKLYIIRKMEEKLLEIMYEK